MIFLDYQDSRPIYEQIVEQYKHLILAGIMETDEQMPSVRALAMELSTNPNTIQKAFSELERQGFIYSVKGRGNFVKQNDALRDAHRLDLVRRMRAVRSEARELGFDADSLWREATESAESQTSDPTDTSKQEPPRDTDSPKVKTDPRISSAENGKEADA